MIVARVITRVDCFAAIGGGIRWERWWSVGRPTSSLRRQPISEQSECCWLPAELAPRILDAFRGRRSAGGVH